MSKVATAYFRKYATSSKSRPIARKVVEFPHSEQVLASEIGNWGIVTQNKSK